MSSYFNVYQATTFFLCVYRVTNIVKFLLTSKGSGIYFSGNWLTPPILVTPLIFPKIGIRAFGVCREGFKDQS